MVFNGKQQITQPHNCFWCIHKFSNLLPMIMLTEFTVCAVIEFEHFPIVISKEDSFFFNAKTVTFWVLHKFAGIPYV